MGQGGCPSFGDAMDINQPSLLKSKKQKPVIVSAFTIKCIFKQKESDVSARSLSFCFF